MTGLILPKKYANMQLELNITTHEGKVVFQFSRPIQEIILEPAQAMQVAESFQRAAMDLMKKGVTEQ